MVNEQLEEGQLVLCTVDKILGTTVFVRLDDYNDDGTITTSEIAPGRIRNLREYVIPNKKIVCKILSIKDNKIQLSLRRVKPNERKELLEKVEKEKSYKAILRTILGKEESEKIIEKISENEALLDFFEESIENPKKLDVYFNQEQSEKILKIFETKKEKPKEIRQIFKLSNKSSSGMTTVKNILQESCNGSLCSITYLAAGKYSIRIEGKDFKRLNNEMNQTMEKVEKLAKKEHCDFLIEKA
ncbi:MAG: hypothetical protein WC867_06950 [Candidatus Pacearchaeota archaeon]|jgi:translation initiation factor 2 alpha subunit (eIF-2alpha)